MPFLIIRVGRALLGLAAFVFLPSPSGWAQTATASSEIIIFTADLTVDRNTNTYWSSASHGLTAVADEWIEIDLGKAGWISGVRLTPRLVPGTTASAYPVDYHLESSIDGTLWNVVPGASFTNFPPPRNVVVHQFNAVSARYFRIFATKLGVDKLNDHSFQLAEIELFPSKQIDLGAVVHVAAARFTPAYGSTNYCYPIDYRYEYSYDEMGQHWFPMKGGSYTNQAEPTGTVTNSFPPTVLARRLRLVPTRRAPATNNPADFESMNLEAVIGNARFPFSTSRGQYFDAQLNMLWTVYGNFGDAMSSADRSTYDFGNEPAWYEWMGLKYGWSTSTAGMFSGLRNARIVPWGQSADGYIWSWGNQEKWPTGNGSYHQENNAKYILGAFRVWTWTRDDGFFDQVDPGSNAAAPRPDVSGGRTMRQKLREAMRYIEESLQGNLGGIQIEDNGMSNTGRPDGEPSNYWDNWPFGYFNAYDNIYYFSALEAMAQMEFYWGNYARAAELRQRRAGCKTDYFNKFWDPQNGRFIACIDKDGQRWDFGGTFHNLEALAYGLGDSEKAGAVFDWLDGRRIVAGDTSTGADIYTWKFAPRANTLKIESVGPPYWWFSLNGAINVTPGTGNARWNTHLENGGAVFYTSYYDLMARLKWLGPDNALARLNTILDEFKVDQLRRDPNTWQLGIIGEFPESGLVPCFLVYGFAGIEPDMKGLHIRPQIPSTWDFLTVRGVRWAGRDLTVTVHSNQVAIVNASTSAGAVFIGDRMISPGNSNSVSIIPGTEILLTTKTNPAAAPARLSLQLQNGKPAVRLNGTVSSTYQLEANFSFSGQAWTVLTNLTLPASSWSYLDTNGPLGRKFYRAIGNP